MYMTSIFGESLFDNMFPFDEKFFTEKKDPLYGKNVSRLMKTDVRETEKTYELDIDLPGFKKDEIQIELKDGYLTVSAEKGLDKDEEDKKGKFFNMPKGKIYLDDWIKTSMKELKERQDVSDQALQDAILMIMEG